MAVTGRARGSSAPQARRDIERGAVGPASRRRLRRSLLQFALTVPGRLTEVVAHRMALWSAAFPRLLLTDHTCAAHGNHLVEGQVLLEDMDCISQLYGAAAMLRAQPVANAGGHGSPKGATGGPLLSRRDLGFAEGPSSERCQRVGAALGASANVLRLAAPLASLRPACPPIPRVGGWG